MGQVGVTPRKSEGIEPFTMVNSLPCQVGVTPRSPGGIEPSSLVKSLPGQVRATPSHPINTLLGPCEVTSSVSSQVPTPTLSWGMPVLSLSMSAPVINLNASGSPLVTSPLCPIPPDTAENHTGYESQTACGPTHWAGSPMICLH